MHLEIFRRLGMWMQDLKPWKDNGFMIFNDSTTRPCGGINMTFSLGEEVDKRSINVYFLIVPCESIFNRILGRPFLAMLDVVASLSTSRWNITVMDANLLALRPAYEILATSIKQYSRDLVLLLHPQRKS